jgi:ABC-type dipeptide/oligopeptide/nickel transport system ATPase subunit
MSESVYKIVSARNLNIFFRNGMFKRTKKYILRDFNLDIVENQIVGLTGESGKGKTTIGKTLLGLHQHYEGDIFWRNISLKVDAIKLLRKKYSWLGQEPFMMFNPNKKIGWVLTETLLINNKKIQKCDAVESIAVLCSSFKIDLQLLDRYPFELSAGQIQRFALIRNILVKPDFLVLDEPISSLDPYNAELFLKLLLSYRERNRIGILFISHNKNLLYKLTNSVIELK